MKKIIFLLISTFLVIPTLADDLQPETSEKAIKEYQDFWKTDSIDSMNHVVWKLYVFRAIPPRANPQGALEYIIAGLTPFPKTSYHVGLKINQFYNYLKPIPKRGDVVVVSGRILNRRNYILALPNKDVPIKMLTMDLDGAISLPQEHFDPLAAPTSSESGTPSVLPGSVPK